MPCDTPEDSQGNCMFLQECKKVYERHQKPILYREDLDFLWNSQCGHFDRRIMVRSRGITNLIIN